MSSTRLCVFSKLMYLVGLNYVRFYIRFSVKFFINLPIVNRFVFLRFYYQVPTECHRPVDSPGLGTTLVLSKSCLQHINITLVLKQSKLNERGSSVTRSSRSQNSENHYVSIQQRILHYNFM